MGIAERLGHEKVETTLNTYSHLYPSTQSKLAGLLDKKHEEERQVEQMPKGSIHERLAWGARKSEMENQQRKKNKTKNRGMER